MTRFIRFVTDLGIASLAGLTAGVLVGGILGRVVMRVSGAMSAPELIGARTEAGNRVGEITLGGTLALVVFIGVASGLVGGVLYRAVEPWLAIFGARWRGAVFGLGLLLVFGFTVLEPFNFDFRRFGSAPLNVAMFALLFPAFGIAITWTIDRLRSVARGRGAVAVVVVVASWIVLVPALLLTMLFAFAPSGASDPLFLIALAAGLAAAWLLRWRGAGRWPDYAPLALPLLVGGWRVVSGVPILLAP